MDPDSRQYNGNLEKNSTQKSSDTLPHDGYVPESTRVRYSFLFNYAVDQFLLGYNSMFLPWCGFFCWVVFLLS